MLGHVWQMGALNIQQHPCHVILQAAIWVEVCTVHLHSSFFTEWPECLLMHAAHRQHVGRCRPPQHHSDSKQPRRNPTHGARQ